MIAKRDWSVHPPYLHEPYKSTVLRAPRRPLVPLAQSLSELTGPAFGDDAVLPGDADLTRVAGRTGEAMGQRIFVTGRILEDQGRPVANADIMIQFAGTGDSDTREFQKERPGFPADDLPVARLVATNASTR